MKTFDNIIPEDKLNDKNLLIELPDKILFTSTGEMVEAKGAVYFYKKIKVNGRAKTIKLKSGDITFVYVEPMNYSPEKPYRKLGKEIDFSIDYINRLFSFGLIKMQFNEDKEGC